MFNLVCELLLMESQHVFEHSSPSTLAAQHLQSLLATPLEGCSSVRSWLHLLSDRLAGLVKVSALRAEAPGFDSRLHHGDFSGSSHTSDFEIGTPVAALPGAWCCRVSGGTGWPGVSILWLGEEESSISNFYLSVTACKIVWADWSLRYISMLLGR